MHCYVPFTHWQWVRGEGQWATALLPMRCLIAMHPSAFPLLLCRFTAVLMEGDLHRGPASYCGSLEEIYGEVSQAARAAGVQLKFRSLECSCCLFTADMVYQLWGQELKQGRLPVSSSVRPPLANERQWDAERQSMCSVACSNAYCSAARQGMPIFEAPKKSCAAEPETPLTLMHPISKTKSTGRQFLRGTERDSTERSTERQLATLASMSQQDRQEELEGYPLVVCLGMLTGGQQCGTSQDGWAGVLRVSSLRLFAGLSVMGGVFVHNHGPWTMDHVVCKSSLAALISWIPAATCCF